MKRTIVRTISLFILLTLSVARAEKQGEVSVAVPIIKLHALPSAESDTRGFGYSGQHYTIDGESGSWYRIRFSDASTAWVTKDAVSVITAFEPEPDQAPVAAVQAPIVAPRPVAAGPGSTAGGGAVPAERVIAPAPHQAANTTAGAAMASAAAPNNGLSAASPNAVGSLPGAVVSLTKSGAAAIAQAGKAVVSSQQATALMPSGKASAAAAPATSGPGATSLRTGYNGAAGGEARAAGAASSPVARGAANQQAAAAGTPVAALATASPIARPLAGTDGSPEMHATAAASQVTAPAGTPGLAVTRPAPPPSTPEEVEATLIRNGGRAIAPLPKRTWFSQFSHLGKTQSGGDIAFFQVSGGRSAVYSLASTNAGILMTAEKGDFFPLLEQTNAWVKVALKDTAGWIERNKGIVVSTPSSGLNEQWSFIVIVITSLAVVAGLLLFLRRKARARKRALEKKTGAGSALEGDIAESNLPEILQFIEIGKKTGCLQLEDSGPLGIIYFDNGRIIHAAAVDHLAGREAVYYVLNLQKGNFRFLLDKRPKVRDLDLSTLEVLMEWTKTEDEAHRH
jgi:uncharacterized protein YgiM (DUF1202 family)